jgi:hypothetical protein
MTRREKRNPDWQREASRGDESEKGASAPVSPPPLTCDDRSGFLFAHACDQPAIGTCSVCAKSICMQHTRATASGPTCITCMRDDTDRDSDHASDHGTSRTSSDDGPERWAGGEGQSGGAGSSGEWVPGPPAASRADDPYFFPGVERAAYYDAEDHAAFEAPTDVGGDADADVDAEVESPETDTGAS